MARKGTANGGIPAPTTQGPEFRESRCHACCKSPYGCARNYVCKCHATPRQPDVLDRLLGNQPNTEHPKETDR